MLRKCIVVVDDEVDVRKSLSLILEWQGYRVITAENGASAFRKIQRMYIQKKHVDLLVCDDVMPVMSGEQFLKKLKEANISIPTLIITGLGGRKSADRFMQLGCRELMEKPFELTNFEKSVSSLLMNKLEVE
jgi:two-component system, NtrC family, nitrogen regulation response regulator NtrX